MPHKKSAYKELRKSKRRHVVNISRTSELKTISKQLEKLIEEKKVEEARSTFKQFSSTVDKAASHGLLHKNTASRRKTRYAKKVAALAKA